MNRTGSTGEPYSDEEKAYVQAGIALGKSAAEIAAHLPGRTALSVYEHAKNVHEVKLPLSKPKPKKQKVKKQRPKTPFQLAESGHFGVRANDDERHIWQHSYDVIFRATGLNRGKDVYEYMRRAGEEKAQEGLNDD